MSADPFSSRPATNRFSVEALAYDQEITGLFLSRLGGYSRHLRPSHEIESRFSHFRCIASFSFFRDVCFILDFNRLSDWKDARQLVHACMEETQQSLNEDPWAKPMLSRLRNIDENQPGKIVVSCSLNGYLTSLLIERILFAICGLRMRSLLQ